MVVEKIVFLYALIGIYLGFLPMLDPMVKDTYNKAKEELGDTGAWMIMFTSAFVVFLFWPLFIFKRK